MNVIKRLVFLGAIWFCYGFWNSLIASDLDDPEWYLVHNEAEIPRDLLVVFNQFKALYEEKMPGFDSDRAILYANALRAKLIKVLGKNSENDQVQKKIRVIPTYIFNICNNKLLFLSRESNKALEALHYTVLYYSPCFLLDRTAVFRPFMKAHGYILTPQDFAVSKERLFGKAYFKHWSKFLPSHSVQGCHCSIL